MGVCPMAPRWSPCIFCFAFFIIASSVHSQTPDCDDLLEENARQKEEIKWLNDVITNNISNLNALIQEVNDKVNDNTGSIEDNSDLIGIVNGRATSNEAHIAQNRLRIDESQANMGELDSKVEMLDVQLKEDEARLESLAVKIEKLHEAPLGTITAWVTRPSPEGDTEASLPVGGQSHPKSQRRKKVPERRKRHGHAEA